MSAFRDRDGDLVERQEDEPPHYCVGGWNGEDAHGRPRPCPICRAETVARVRRQRARTEPDNPVWSTR
jgi:hypothetical protein